MHSYGMQRVNSDFFLPREAFLTECRHSRVFPKFSLVLKNLESEADDNPLGLYLSVERRNTTLKGHPVRDASLGREKHPQKEHPVRDASFGREKYPQKQHPVRDASFGREKHPQKRHPVRDASFGREKYPQKQNPVRDASLTGCTGRAVYGFSTERSIPNGMQPRLRFLNFEREHEKR